MKDATNRYPLPIIYVDTAYGQLGHSGGSRMSGVPEGSGCGYGKSHRLLLYSTGIGYGFGREESGGGSLDGKGMGHGEFMNHIRGLYKITGYTPTEVKMEAAHS